MSADPDFSAQIAADLEAQRKRADLSWMEDNPDRPHVIDWNELEGREPPPRYWHLDEWLGDDPCLFSGRGGVGKTLVAQAVGTALSVGLKFITPAPAEPVTVLMWACEDSKDELWRRQVAINRYFGIGMKDLDGRLVIEARRGMDNTLFATAFGKPMFTGLREELEAQVGDYGARVVILDNIGQVFGASEKERHDVTAFINGLAGIGAGKVSHFTPMLLGHVARSQGSEFAGSAAWENACRMRWYLGNTPPDQEPDEDEATDPDVVYLAKRKSNYSAHDVVKLAYRNGLMAPIGTEVDEFDPAADTAEAVVLSAFDRIVAAGVLPTDGRTSPDYLPNVIKRMDLSRTFTKKELAAAMGRLMGQGRLVRKVVGTYGNRSPRLGLARV